MSHVELRIRGVSFVVATKVPLNSGLACVPAACLEEVISLFVGCGTDFELEWPEQ